MFSFNLRINYSMKKPRNEMSRGGVEPLETIQPLSGEMTFGRQRPTKAAESASGGGGGWKWADGPYWCDGLFLLL